jgi:hypothetical protein
MSPIRITSTIVIVALKHAVCGLAKVNHYDD